ncbi:LacI family transcriptional regulator, partial [Shigella dysenteriae]
LMPFYFRKECPLNSGYLSRRTALPKQGLQLI